MRNITRSVALSLFALVLGACGKEDAPEAKTASAAPDRDPCALVTAAEVEAIRGMPVEAVRERDEHGIDSCKYRDPARPERVFMMVDAYWTDGKQEWMRWHAATAGAVRMMDHTEPGTDAAAVIDSQAIKGPHFRSTYSIMLGGHLLKGDSFLWFRFFSMPESPEMFASLAEKAAARL